MTTLPSVAELMMGIRVPGQPENVSSYTKNSLTTTQKHTEIQSPRRSPSILNRGSSQRNSSGSNLPTSTMQLKLGTGSNIQLSQIAAGSIESSPESCLRHSESTLTSSDASSQTHNSQTYPELNRNAPQQCLTNLSKTHLTENLQAYDLHKTNNILNTRDPSIYHPAPQDQQERFTPLYTDYIVRDNTYQPEQYYHAIKRNNNMDESLLSSPKRSLSESHSMPVFPSYSHYIVPTDPSRAPIYPYSMPQVAWGNNMANGPQTHPISSHYSQVPGSHFGYRYIRNDRPIFSSIPVTDSSSDVGHPHRHDTKEPIGASKTSAEENVAFVKRRAIKRRTRTGCLTCRKRRIKCDEQKPHCFNCQRSRKLCLGYETLNNSPFQPEKEKEPVSSQQ